MPFLNGGTLFYFDYHGFISFLQYEANVFGNKKIYHGVGVALHSLSFVSFMLIFLLVVLVLGTGGGLNRTVFPNLGNSYYIKPFLRRPDCVSKRRITWAYRLF